MILSEFLDMWTRKNCTIALCKASHYDHMFDIVDEINDGIMDPFTCPSNADFTSATICAFDPYLSQFKTEYYLRDEWLNAEVVYFFVKDKLVIIWIRNENDNESDID